MVEKYGTWPASARVDVDYSKGKPKIKFTYPKTGRTPKKDAERQLGSGPFSLILLILIVGGSFIFIFTQGDMYETVEYPKECNVSLDSHYLNMSWYTESDGVNTTMDRYKTWIEGANITCGNKTYLVTFNRNIDKLNSVEEGFYFKSLINPWERINNSMFPFYVLGISVIVFIIINKQLGKVLIKQKWYQKWIPKHQAEGLFRNGKRKYIKFKPEDVENNIVEIPYFKNVILEYKTDGDFSDKLERIKIREHQYHEYERGKIGKKKVRISEWYARFYFKEKPQTGYLEVIFK